MASLSLSHSQAGTASFTAVADASIHQFAADSNFSGVTNMAAGAVGNGGLGEIRRAFLRFDLSSQLPAGAIINSVSVRVLVIRESLSAANSVFDLRLLLEQWSENEVTWNSRLTGTPWEVPGATGAADLASLPSSAVFVTGLGSYTFPSTPGLVADVQGWANNPSNNFGWLLLSEDEATRYTARQFATYRDLNNGPSLVINYSLPPPVILVQPQSQSVIAGSTVAFSVTASNAPPLFYQWQFNGQPLVAATNSTLVLNNVQTNQSGAYTVTVSNANGSTNSQPAILTVSLPPPGLPFVNIISPANGAQFLAPASVLLAALAEESNGTITQVEFFLDANSAGVATNASPTNSLFSLVVSNLVAGNYLLNAIATDTSLNTATSSVAQFSVTNVPPPPPPPMVVLTLSSSSTNFPLGTMLTNTATVTSQRAITNVEFFDGANLLGQTESAPFTFVWKPTQTRTYSLTAVAFNDFGQAGTSAPVVIRVFLPETVSPLIVLTSSPPNFARLKLPQVRLAGTASDKIGLDQVEYQVNTAPYYVPATGTNSWVANITLPPGNDTIRVRSVNLAGINSTPVTRFFTYVVESLLTVRVHGAGTVAPDLTGRMLEVGAVYSLTARPGPGQIFAGWQGVASRDPSLGFVMQSNLVLVADFAPSPFSALAGAYAGLFFDTNSPLPATSGFFTLQLGGSGVFSGKVTTNGAGIPFTGQFDLLGQAKVPVVRRAFPPVVLALLLDLANSAGQINGAVTNALGTFTTNLVVTALTNSQGMITTNPSVIIVTNVSGTNVASPLLAERNPFRSGQNPAPQAGRRPFVLERMAAEGGAVVGNGIASISSAGIVTFHGSLSDGRMFNSVSALSVAGLSPFYLPLSGGTEVIIGWIELANGSGTPVAGSLLWLHAGSSTQLAVFPSP